MRYIRLAVNEAKLARVPNQLIEPDADKDPEDEASSNEHSGVGAIGGFSAPLGSGTKKQS